MSSPWSLRAPSHLGDKLILTAVLTLAAGIAMHFVREVPQPLAPAPPARQAPDAQAPTTTPGVRTDVAGRLPGPEHREKLAGLTLSVPDGWERATSHLAVGFESGDGSNVTRIYAARHGPPKDFADQAGTLLAAEHPGAKLTIPRQTSVGGVPATRVRATYPGGQETAAVMAGRQFYYLVLQRLDQAAGHGQRLLAAAMVSSITVH